MRELRVKAETFMGKPCKRGHDGLRYLSGSCVKCTRERDAQNRLDPKKRTAKLERESRRREQIKADPKKLARYKEQQKQWYAATKADPQKYAELRARYRGYNKSAEKEIERYLVEQVRAHGGFAPKFVDTGRAGAPDRIVILPNGDLHFVELKTRHGRVKKHQERYHEKLLKLHQRVEILRSKEEIDRWLKDVARA